MAELKEKLRTDMTASMKARDALRTQTLRMVMTAISNAEVAGRESQELSDSDVISILVSEHKKRKESAQAFDQGNRPELADKERVEAAILAEYLPEPLTDGEIAELVSAAIDNVGGNTLGLKAMGQVMGIVTPQTKGKADGSAVAAEVKRQLGS